MEPRILLPIWFFAIFQLFTAFCNCKDSITMNQIFKHGDLLISRNNNFALGFFSSGTNSERTYLGIWFYEVSLQTVVWVANRNNPINGNESGFLSINKHGNLALSSEGFEDSIWSTNVSGEAANTLSSQVQLLDSGNLILMDATNGRILWQSFDYPTNTLLPGMKLGINRISGINWFLTSWRSENDPGSGAYSYRLNVSGWPQVYLYNGMKHYSRNCPCQWRKGHFYFNYSLVENENEIYGIFSTHSVLARIVVEASGVLKWLAWNEKHSKWKELGSFPSDRCDLYGKCGPNSNCDSKFLNKFECNCFPGYEPKSPEDWNLRDGSDGCIRKRLNYSSVCRHGEGFVKLEAVKIPDFPIETRLDLSSSSMECEIKCKSNCSCSAYSNLHNSGSGSICLHWYGDLIDTVSYIGDTGYDLYIRVDALELAESASGSNSIFEKKGMLSLVILSAASAWVSLIIILVYFYRRNEKIKGTMKSKRNKTPSYIRGSNYKDDTLALVNELERGNSTLPDWLLLNFNAILSATDNFSPLNKIGRGGFGTVYKGQLENGKEIAVKRMFNTSSQGIEELKNEATLIAKLQHRNLVKLLGCCIRRSEQVLVYEYMPNKSLDSFLFDQTRKSELDWEKRFNIVVGIARGILYLHQDSTLRIIHRDLKTSNILLDAEMNPKVSDFGTARLFQNDQIQGKTNRVVGTYGYMSPEYAVFGKFSVKSDVFSYGVIVLEIVTGKKNNGLHEEGPSSSLIGQVWKLWNQGRAVEIVDALLKESYDPHQALRCVQIGLLCVQENAMERPTMLEVVLMLNSDSTLPSPKQPAFVFRAASTNTSSSEEDIGSYSVNEVTITDVQAR